MDHEDCTEDNKMNLHVWTFVIIPLLSFFSSSFSSSSLDSGLLLFSFILFLSSQSEKNICVDPRTRWLIMPETV